MERLFCVQVPCDGQTDATKVRPNSCYVEAFHQAKKRSWALLYKICGSLFCGKWEGRIVEFGKEGFWGEGCHTRAGFQRMGKTLTATGHHCQGDNRAKEISTSHVLRRGSRII